MRYFKHFYALALLCVGMGLGRFLLTPLVPVLMNEGRFTLGSLSLMASANYLGYLAGSLLGSSRALAHAIRPERVVIGCTFTTAVTLFAMGNAESEAVAMVLRFFAGMASAGLMVFGALVIFQAPHMKSVAPLFFAGVGAGIVLGNEWVNLAVFAELSSVWVWRGAGLFSLVVCGLLIFRQPGELSQPDAAATRPPGVPSMRWWMLVLIYGMAGFGYIIAATYLPLLAKQTSFFPQHVWTLFGIAALPAGLYWMRLAHRIGYQKTLILNLLIQAVSTLLLALGSPLGLVFAALGMGSSFMGTVALVMSLARQVVAPGAIQLMALVTFSYGIGQVLGPLVVLRFSVQETCFFAAMTLAVASVLVQLSMEEKHAIREY
ncbi:YbfB/YjiJ family MFS transporter (plasmid) [Photobacterium sp. GJ3]|uniref:YbfB/YjiJ family MFS transporter n=1 Tax=Photobacterium sp. GJ3 TaxID=2829502 RepID=UPI001B8C6FE8|nr:YbfB/YjiJ family MFS transporter [Photobacterium sp. GJ3]QUJ69542.1 YbfB/YjiJ family MFS transporter [Photobacterium sp. GJ3]